MADASKPLPDIPVTHLLSVDARKHRRKVIKALLGLLNEVEPELEDPDWEDLGERDPGPVARIEKALDTSSDIESLLPPSVHASSLIYLQCSLVVEETFLRECGVSMSYPHPKDKTKHSSAGSMASSPLTEGSPSSSKRTSFIPSSILNFFSKRSVRNGDNMSPRSSFDSPPGYIRQRRFSLLHHNLHYPVKEVKREPETYPLSTSPGVEFPSSSPSNFLRNQAICVLVNSHKMETFYYYTKDDQRLEAVLRSLDADTDWTHAGVRIRATVSVDPDQPTSSDTDPSPPEPPVDQPPVIHLFSNSPLTPHLSFGKFIELVVYSPRMKAFLESHSNTLRFGIGTKLVAVTVERDISVYTLCAPRVQPSSSSSSDDVNADEDKVSLRREIRAWWETVAAHLDSIEEDIQVVTHKKRLPRLPSEWSEDPEDTPPPSSSTLSASSSSSGSDNPDVGSLRETCHAREQALYAQLAKCGIDGINGVRRQFLRAARDVDNVLTKMQHSSDGSTVKSKESTGTVTSKMASGGDTVKGKPLDAGERHSDNGEDQKTQTPVWWSQPCHVPPTGNVIVRENDWGSIIAFTMSTADYHASLAVPSTQSEPLLTPSLSKAETPSFFSSFRASALSSASSSASSLHKESNIFDDGFSAVISRKETPTGMLEVFKDKGSKFNSLRFHQVAQRGSDRRDSALSEAGSNGVPPSSWSKVTSAGGTITGDARSMKVEMGSIDMTDNGSVSDTSEGGSDDTVAPQVPPKDIRFPGADPPTDENERPPPLPSKSTLRSTLDRWLFANVAEGVTDARPHIKYDFTVSQGAFPSTYPPASASSHPPAPRRLKFSCTIYYASSFSTLRSKCSVSNSAYVKSLSRIVPFNAEGGKSSSGFWRSEDGRWVIKGLVSKWGVADLGVLLGMGGRYFDWVLREAGGVGGMVKLMGFYTVEVRNLDTGTGEKVDLVVMENLFWGRNIDRKYDLKGIQTRKVKRKDKDKDKDKDTEGDKEKELPSSGVLFDAEWLQGPQLLVTPQSKAVLTSALCADAAWLAQSNIMDYSLLLGVDNEKGEIVGGIVDTIGSYTFAKTLEYNLKSNAARKPEEVTVVPPTEYQERFVAAINRYFVECPDMSSVESEGQREWDLPDMTSMHL